MRSESSVVAPTQAALYDELRADDLHLSWPEQELPERERTKHVHRLHPYLGKFVPQLVEALLGRYVRPGVRVLDPFAGSGTTARRRSRAATSPSGSRRARPRSSSTSARCSRSTRTRTCCASCWRVPRARRVSPRTSISSSRRSRSARRTGATSTVASVAPFRRRTSSSLAISSTPSSGSRPSRACATAAARQRCCTGDARELDLRGPFDAVVTSPPYPGLIDYHEQHRYAYELIGLDDLRERELGAAARGTSKAAVEEYVTGIAAVLGRCAEALRPGAPVLVVVNDRRGLYPGICERSGLGLVDRLERHVNRRTGRRAGEYFESILVATR